MTRAAIHHPDVYFTPEYGLAECQRNAFEWLTVERLDGAFQLPLVVRPLADGMFDAISPYGYSGAYAEPNLPTDAVAQAWRSALDELRDRLIVSVFLRHSPLVPQARLPSSSVPIIRDHATVAVDVRDAESAWNGMASRCRNTVRKAKRLGATVEIRKAQRDDLVPSSPFRRHYDATMRRRDASTFYSFPDAYYEQLVDGLEERLLVAHAFDADGTVQSAALFLRHGRRLHYHLSGSSVDGGRAGMNNLLLWAAMEHASGTGVTLLHLGGGTGRGEDPLLRFKESFGPLRLAYNASGLVVEPDVYRQLVDSVPGQPGNDFFPAYRSRRDG